VQAVTEYEQSVVLFGSKGVQTFTSGALVRSDQSITAWRAAAVIPSADGVSTWLVGIDDTGHVQRISADMTSEDVSDRFGLTADKVQMISGGGSETGFVLESGAVALADGANLTRYPVAAQSIAANGGHVALADGAVLRVFEKGVETDTAIPDVQFVAYDGAGALVAASAHHVYQVSASGISQDIYDAGDRTIHQLAGGGSSVWFEVDGDLGVLQSGTVAVASGGTLPPRARLVGSPSGDVWTIAGGQLQRWNAKTAAGGDEATWSATVQPIYAAVCSECHSPPGSGKSSSNIDMSTYQNWSSRRDRVYARVVEQAGTATAMPPPTSAFVLTDDQRAAIAAWAKP
jgi:mono/diheme cytochrome c family protein